MKRPRIFSSQGKRVLHALMICPSAWRHGYDLMGELDLKSGTLYPLLMRLSDRDILEAKWDDPQFNGRPPRQMYRLTQHGIDVAAQTLADEMQENTVAQPPAQKVFT